MKNLILFILCLISTPILAQDGSVLEIILGEMSFNYFLVMLLFAILGAILNMTSDNLRRRKGSKHSPDDWSLKYWWADNQRKIIATVVLIPVAILTCNGMFGIEITKSIAFGIGFGSDHLIEIAKRKELQLFKGISIASKEEDEKD